MLLATDNPRSHDTPSSPPLAPSAPPRRAVGFEGAAFQSPAIEKRAEPAIDEQDFSSRLLQHLPDLRKRALLLTRDSARADDLVQDTLERALRFSASFREGTHLRAWLMRILQNVFISGRRRSKTERRVLEGAFSDPNGWAKKDAPELLPGLSPPVERALDELPPRLREVIDLVDLGEHSYRDAAAVQAVPVGTIMSRLHRGRARLKLMLSTAHEGHAA